MRGLCHDNGWIKISSLVFFVVGVICAATVLCVFKIECHNEMSAQLRHPSWGPGQILVTVGILLHCICLLLHVVCPVPVVVRVTPEEQEKEDEEDEENKQSTFLDEALESIETHDEPEPSKVYFRAAVCHCLLMYSLSCISALSLTSIFLLSPYSSLSRCSRCSSLCDSPHESFTVASLQLPEKAEPEELAPLSPATSPMSPDTEAEMRKQLSRTAEMLSASPQTSPKSPAPFTIKQKPKKGKAPFKLKQKGGNKLPPIGAATNNPPPASMRLPPGQHVLPPPASMRPPPTMSALHAAYAASPDGMNRIPAGSVDLNRPPPPVSKRPPPSLSQLPAGSVDLDRRAPAPSLRPLHSRQLPIGSVDLDRAAPLAALSPLPPVESVDLSRTNVSTRPPPSRRLPPVSMKSTDSLDSMLSTDWRPPTSQQDPTMYQVASGCISEREAATNIEDLPSLRYSVQSSASPPGSIKATPLPNPFG